MGLFNNINGTAKNVVNDFRNDENLVEFGGKLLLLASRNPNATIEWEGKKVNAKKLILAMQDILTSGECNEINEYAQNYVHDNTKFEDNTADDELDMSDLEDDEEDYYLDL